MKIEQFKISLHKTLQHHHETDYRKWKKYNLPLLKTNEMVKK